MIEITTGYVAFVLIFLAGMGMLSLLQILSQFLSGLAAFVAGTGIASWAWEVISQLFK